MRKPRLRTADKVTVQRTKDYGIPYAIDKNEREIPRWLYLLWLALISGLIGYGMALCFLNEAS